MHRINPRQIEGVKDTNCESGRRKQQEQSTTGGFEWEDELNLQGVWYSSWTHYAIGKTHYSHQSNLEFQVIPIFVHIVNLSY